MNGKILMKRCGAILLIAMLSLQFVACGDDSKAEASESEETAVAEETPVIMVMTGDYLPVLIFLSTR